MKYLIPLFLSLLLSYSSAQHYNFKVYNRVNDFQQNQILTVFQDMNGFIWVGSGIGLTRYDGEEWIHISVEDGLPANEVISIDEDDSGNLWIGTGYGLARINISNHNLPKVSPVEIDELNRDINVLKFYDKKLWIGTANRGLFCLENGADNDYTFSHYFENGNIMDIQPGAAGRLLIIERDSGLFEIEHNGSVVNHFPGPAQTVFTSLHPARNGKELWLGTTRGLLKWEAEGEGYMNNTPAIPIENQSYVHRVIMDKKNIVWAACDKGILRVDGSEAELISEQQGLPTKGMREVFADRENNIWVGSYTAGLVKLSNPGMVGYSRKNGFLPGVVNAIHKEDEQKFLLATDAGIYTLHNKRLHYDPRFMALKNDIIWFIYPDRSGRLWFGGEKSIYSYQRGKLDDTIMPEIAGEAIFYDMIQDRENRYWFGTSLGLYILDKGRMRHVTELSERGIINVLDIEEGRDGTIYLGTDNGFVKHKDNIFTIISKEDGLPDRAVFEIHEDRHGKMWLGCDLGLIEVLDKGYRLYGSEKGLKGKIITQILEDEQGDFWLCSERGLQKFSAGEGRQCINRLDGLVGDEFTTQNSSYLDDDGTLLLGVFGGLSIYNPDVDGIEERQAGIALKKAVCFENVKKQENLGLDEVISIPFSHRNLVFDFHGIYFYNEDDVTFQYKLEGVDETFNTIGRAGEVRYSNLWPGKYVLKANVQLKSRSANNASLEKTILIEKPFYMEIWFIIVFIVLFLLLGLVILKNRVSRFKRVNRQLEKLIATRTQELALTKNMLENIIENAGSAIITLDTKQKITTWNRRAELIFFFPKKAVIGKTLKILDTENDPFPFSQIYEEAVNSGELHQLEVKKRTKEGSLVELILTATPIFEEDNSVSSVTMSMEDFSERNRLIDSLINRERLLAGIGALNKLLATLSHYINNSIMAIHGMAQLVRIDDSHADKFLQTTEVQIARIEAVLKSLSDLVKRLNLKTMDYVGEKDSLFDIENEIKGFLETINKKKKQD